MNGSMIKRLLVSIEKRYIRFFSLLWYKHFIAIQLEQG